MTAVSVSGADVAFIDGTLEIFYGRGIGAERKLVVGRKTDVRGTEWIAERSQNASFIPPLLGILGRCPSRQCV